MASGLTIKMVFACRTLYLEYDAVVDEIIKITRHLSIPVKGNMSKATKIHGKNGMS